MTNCGAPNCTNRSNDKNKSLSFHRIPQKADLRKKWLQNLKRQNMPDNIFICSEHFESSCFKRDFRAELMNTKPRHDLEDDAVSYLIRSHYDLKKKSFFCRKVK